MAWLLSEIFVITLAAAIFGVLIGLGIAGANRRAAALLERYRKLRARVEGLEHALHGAETRAAARSVAEAAVRTDLEGRLVELDEAAAQYRARAEAAERRVRVMEAQKASSIVAVPEVAAPDGRSGDASDADSETQDERTSIRRERTPVPLIDAVRMGLSRGGASTLRDGNGETAPALLHRLDQGERPPSLAAPREGQADDLRRIKGIGPRNEGVLNALGIYHFDQLADLTDAQVAWLDAYFRFHGRIAREDWAGQAARLVEARAHSGISDKVHPEEAEL